MMISTKGRYALRVMIDIAEHQHDGYIPLKEIAARQEISEKYLEAIVKSLVKERYLTGLRGKSGGYRLTKTPEEYTVGSTHAARMLITTASAHSASTTHALRCVGLRPFFSSLRSLLIGNGNLLNYRKRAYPWPQPT